MPPSFAYRITKYDPADRDEHGGYNGAEDSVSDHGAVEAAYLEAVAAFARDSGVDRLEIREPEVAGPVNFGLEAPVEGHGLAGLFPPDLAGYHDGAEVSVPTALELVRAMLRDNGAWCRLECGDTFTVHVGWDQYVYVGSDRPCEVAVARTGEIGLFAEPITASPYAGHLEQPEVTEAADEDFWGRVRAALATSQALLLEETHVRNASRWHRLTEAGLDTLRLTLGPRALLTVWPDLTPDVDAVLASLPEDEWVEFVWEAPDATIRHLVVDETGHQQLAVLAAGARAACLLPRSPDEHPPLFRAALPDSDGVLRARW
ncbi:MULTISPECIES: RNA-binding protein [unclassified Streptomyces]|uniref:RNA-binding protein n=1 Tax=unclassified Streptomyces TaxID=2593676 RepID=UPI00093A6EAA|nr:RNA-binding protein [Streptomyces sp. CB02058]OKI93711.1 RNA-binding protein [Streptomyces sp. CB02058]